MRLDTCMASSLLCECGLQVRYPPTQHTPTVPLQRLPASYLPAPPTCVLRTCTSASGNTTPRLGIVSVTCWSSISEPNTPISPPVWGSLSICDDERLRRGEIEPTVSDLARRCLYLGATRFYESQTVASSTIQHANLTNCPFGCLAC
jgi:hypothetical protein